MTAPQKTTTRKSRKLVLSDSRAQDNAKLLSEFCREYPTKGINGFGSLVNYSPLSDQPIHRWFRYREGYSIQLVKELIKDLPRGSIIVDPFCGAGATLLAAQQLGFESYGFDINPMSVLVSKVKTRDYSKSAIAQFEAFKHRASTLSPAEEADPPPALRIIDKVFHPEILQALLVLRRVIKSEEDPAVRDFLMVAWLSILEGVSNVYKEGNGIKYKNRKRTPKGYVTIPDEEWQSSAFPGDKFTFVIARFTEQLSVMIDDIEERGYKAPPAHVIECSAESVHEHIPENTASYVVFSPPYCNCFNYFKIFKIELWMGEFVTSYSDMQSLNRRALRSHVETVLEREGDSPIEYVDSFVAQIDTSNIWDKRIPRAVQGYFMDMKSVMSSLYKVLKPSGNCAIVVGNSAYSGIVIPTDAILARISSEVGLQVQHISVARHLTTSSQQKMSLEGIKDYLRESIVFIQKPDPRLTDRELVHVDELPKHIEHGKEKVYVIKNNGLTKHTHKFHRYPGKFIPHIPRWAIEKYASADNPIHILDPFCGSGTSNVEAMLAGHSSYGIDVDPIARLVSKVKTTPILLDTLKKAVGQVKRALKQRKSGRYRPSIPTLGHWFNDKAIEDLSVIRDIVESFRDKKDLYDFFMVCFIAIIRRASNADNQTIKTYVSHTHPKVPEPAKELFLKVIDDYSARLAEFSGLVPSSASTTILDLDDSRNIPAAWSESGHPNIDLVVTSPPYLKSVDYLYNQMAEYFWIGDLFGLEDQAKQNKYKRRYIGTEKVIKKEYQDLSLTGLQRIDTLIETLYAKDQKHSYIVSQYFRSMMDHLQGIRKIMKPDAHYIMVIGDSVVSNEAIETHDLIQDCAQAAGFRLDTCFGYEIRNRHMRFPRQGRGGIVRYDWILDFIRTE